MLKFLSALLFDEVGTWAAIAAAVIGGGASIYGSSQSAKAAKKAGSREPFEGYYGNLVDILGTAKTGMNQPGQLYGGSFEGTQPAVEGAAEETILGKLKNPLSPTAFSSDITQKHYAARKARAAEGYEDEIARSRDMYNNLGLVSSTPGLQAQGDIRETQRLAEEEISSGLMYEDIQREIESTKMVEDIMNQYLTQAQVLGGTQRGAEQWTQGMGYQDFARSQQMPLEWGKLASNVLGSAGQPQFQEPGTNWMEQVGGLGMDLSSMMMMMNMLGNKGKGGGTNATTSIE